MDRSKGSDKTPVQISNLKLFFFTQIGKTAESYLNHEESEKILSHKDLLRSFGAGEELADEMLNDQGTCFRYHLSKHS